MLMKRPRRRWTWIAVPVLLAAAAAALVLMPAAPLPVRLSSCTVGPVEETVVGSSVGTVEAEQTSVLSAEVSGRVVAIRVRQGPAKTGAPLVEIDPADARAEREQTLRDIGTAKLRVEQARLRVEKAEAELKRSSGPEESAWRIESLQKDLAIARKDVEIAAAAVRTQEAALELVELKLRKTVVAAPYDGVVTKLHVEVGEIVTPGRQLLTIQSSLPFVVRGPIDEVDLGRVGVDQETRVTFDAFRDRSFPGRLVEIKPAASTDQKNNRTVEVKVTVADVPPSIVAGMSAHLEIIIRRKESALRLATPQIREDHASRTRFVFVMDEAGMARRRTIRTGLWNWDQTEIVEGLSERDRVIVEVVDPNRNLQLADGQRVRVSDGR